MRTAARRYRALFVAPGVRPVFIASLIGRLPIGMATLLFVLVVHAGIGSYAVAGLAAAANSAATAAFGPPLGRLADRGHASIVLVTTGLAQGAAFVVLVIVLHAQVPAWVVVAVAAGIGAVNPPIAAVTRTVLPRLAPDEPTRRTAFALDALLVEITYVVGPATVVVCRRSSTDTPPRSSRPRSPPAAHYGSRLHVRSATGTWSSGRRSMARHDGDG